MRFKVKLSLGKKNDAERADLGEHTHDCMNGNPLFVSPNPSLVTYKNGYLEYRAAYENGLLGGKPLKAALREKRKAFMSLLRQMASYVNNIANGDATIITNAGFDTNGTPNSHTMSQVTGVTAKTGLHTGEVKLKWIIVESAVLYLVYARLQGSDDAYALVLKTSRSKCVVKNLDAGAVYEFAIESCGNGEDNAARPSEPVQARASF
jgi:hypothetical protein